MKNIKRIILVFILIFTISLSCVPAFAVSQPIVNAKSAIVIDRATGDVLYGKNENDKVYPASTTKIMTILIAVEAVNSGKFSLNDTVTASENLYFDITEDAVSLKLQPGEEFTLEQLIYCAMICSCNEACNIIAEYIGGSVSAFVAEMNSRAQELGCTGTHFVNTHGLQDENHYTTAYDMYLITKAALDYPFFEKVCTSVSYELKPTNMSDGRILYTTNNLISQHKTTAYFYEYASGVKTGSTEAAGHCLVSTAKKDGIDLFCAVFGSTVDVLDDNTSIVNSFVDSKNLYEWVFNNFSYQDILKDTELICELPVTLGEGTDSVILRPESSITALLPNDFNIQSVRRSVDVGDNDQEGAIVAPVTAGDVFGQIKISCDGKDYGSMNLVAMRSVKRSSVAYLKSRIDNVLNMKWLKVSFICIIILIVLYIALVVRYNIIRRQKRKKAREAAAAAANAKRYR